MCDPRNLKPNPTRAAVVLHEVLADGSAVLYHTTSRQLMTLNPTGALVWELCDGSLSTDGIAEEVRSVFPDAVTVAADVAAVLAQLHVRGMLAAAPVLPAPAGAAVTDRRATS